MDPEKKEALEFCMDKFIINRMVDIWLTIILTLGLAVLIFPILIWLIYRYINGKKKIEILKAQINSDPHFISIIHAVQTRNSIVVDLNGTSLEIPQLYIWLSKYTKNELVKILNGNNAIILTPDAAALPPPPDYD